VYFHKEEVEVIFQDQQVEIQLQPTQEMVVDPMLVEVQE
jgi:hypothetical protein